MKLWKPSIIIIERDSKQNFSFYGDRIYPSPEHMQATGPSLQIGGASMGRSLPDLTSLQVLSPLSTPIDPEDQGNQTMSPTQPFSMPQRQNLVARRQHSNQQQIRKSRHMTLMDANISPLEDRLQQFQLYPGGNIGTDYSSHGNCANNHQCFTNVVFIIIGPHHSTV